MIHLMRHRRQEASASGLDGLQLMQAIATHQPLAVLSCRRVGIHACDCNSPHGDHHAGDCNSPAVGDTIMQASRRSNRCPLEESGRARARGWQLQQNISLKICIFTYKPVYIYTHAFIHVYIWMLVCIHAYSCIYV